MAVNVNVRRLAQQRTRVTEIHLSPLPSPPAALLKFPGVGEWWKQMLDVRERDQQSIYQSLLTKATGGDDNVSTPDCCATLTAALDEEAAIRAAEDVAINIRIDNLPVSTGDGDDTLSWMNL